MSYYRIKEIIKHPVGIFDRLNYALRSNDVQRSLSFFSKDYLPIYKNSLTEVACWNIKTAFLFTLVRILKPEIVVETGVATGGTTQAILRAMYINQKGHLYSIDLHVLKSEDGSDKPEFVVGRLVPNNLKSRWTFIDGDSKIELPKLLKKLGQIDIFIHDSLHTYNHMKFEFNTAYPYIKKGGVLFSDDIFFNHAFMEFSKNKKHYVISRVMGYVIK